MDHGGENVAMFESNSFSIFCGSRTFLIDFVFPNGLGFLESLASSECECSRIFT